jgi:FAD/FMN-containing dehydrogenase
MHIFIEQLRLAKDIGLLSIGDDIPDRCFSDWMTTAPRDSALALVRPRSTAEVSELLRLCHAAGVPVVPQGGMTGLAGGAQPIPNCVLLSLELMKKIEEVDTAACTVITQAGATLSQIQDIARENNLFFPLDLGARGSCTVGGNLSTNAGGNRVLRYGMARDLVLGLEVVLADGTVLSNLNKMLKNNTGYDLKQLFLGSEGTLGVITRAVLKLSPQPRSTCTALCALTDYDAVLKLLKHVRTHLGPNLSAFEMMWPDFYERMTSGLPHLTTPLPYGNGAYVLIESQGTDPVKDQSHFEQALTSALESEIVQDVVIAQSEADVKKLWAVRDSSGEFRAVFWPHVGFDISVTTGQLGNFVEDLKNRLKQKWPDTDTVFFGHVGDSNIHIGVKVCSGDQPEPEIEDLVYQAVGDWHGSISAEHGIGTLKREYLHYSRSPEEMSLMKSLKSMMDPRRILNPGKILFI